MAKTETRKQQYERLRAQLKAERESFVSTWRDISDFILPRRGRFFLTDANKGDRRNQKIIDSTGTKALRTLRSGLMSGVTSPARPWFRLTTPDPKLAEIQSVKEWLSQVSQNMNQVFLRSNLYNTLPIVYGDVGSFGTGVMLAEEDADNVIHFYAFPIGSYMLGTDSRGKINTFIREFRMTVGQIIEKFGKDSDGQRSFKNISINVRNLFENGDTESWIDVCHVIRPNEMYDNRKLDSKFKKYSSCYYELNSGESNEVLLSEKGFDFFPVMAPRWGVTAEDVYGTDSPGVDAIGDIKALQLMQKKKLRAVEKMVDPPVVAPSHLKMAKTSFLPGSVMYSDSDSGKGIRAAYEVKPQVQELLVDIQDHRQRIRSAFFEDLFLMLVNTDRREITAREIDARYEEKLLALGPVLEQLNQDLLDPLIDITFYYMNRQGLIPPAPEELQGIDLRVEYVSIMAQAQKLVGLSGVERFLGFASSLAQVSPQVLDKIDFDQTIDIFGEMVGVPPGIIRPDAAVEELRSQRAKAQQEQQAMAMVPEAAKTAKTLAETDMGNDETALAEVVKGMGMF